MIPKTEIYFASRKTSSAHVYITKGKGKVRINNVPVEMINPEHAMEVILTPLEIIGDELRDKIDISVKMYKSARYYYKNKSLVETPPKKRRPYIRLDPEILKCIDDHIGCSRQQKPSAAFRSFMDIQAETVQKSARILHDKGLMQDDIDAKIKKTFKNRYFRLITK